MPFHDRFTLPSDDQHDVDAAWFDKQKQRRVQKNDPTLRGCLAEEVDALKAFHDRDADAGETAAAMTVSISTSPVPDLGGYSDGILCLNIVWNVLIAALVEWPSARRPDLFALLDAIAQVSDKIHKGEALDPVGRQLAWDEYPFFAMNWPDDLQPGEICRQCPDQASLSSARRVYLRIKDIEAQLVARHIMGVSRQMIQYIIRALETNIDNNDSQSAPDEAAAYKQVKLDFHIPAISSLFRYNCHEIYDQVVRDGLKDLTQRQMPDGAMDFGDGAERWLFWKRRLGELAHGDAADEVKSAAEATLQSMTSAV